MVARNPLNTIRDKVFNHIHGKNLVYNTCWEDPRCDRELLQMDSSSKVVMITSAGCNALDYLLDEPARIYAMDVNSRQNALLDFKKAVFQKADFNDLYCLFGKGCHKNVDSLYYNKLRPVLSTSSQKFWDQKLWYFKGTRHKKSFYFFGTSGNFAWLFRRYLKMRPEIHKGINMLLDSETLEEQRRIYYRLEPRLVNSFVKWFMDRHITLAMLGIPRPQRKLILDEYPGGMFAYIRDSLRRVFTQVSIQDNYFWRLYMKGEYTPECCPNYLREENFAFLRSRVDRISTHNTTMSDFLRMYPDEYSHFVLLDHQDWLASYSYEALKEEWRLILQNSRPGARVLIRSAAPEIHFFPAFVTRAVTFYKVNQERLNYPDRVGTYGSAYIGIVQ